VVGAATRQEEMPPDVSDEAIRLRESAAKRGVVAVMEGFRVKPSPCVKRLYDESIYELSLTVRASNGLMRAGVQTFGRLRELLESEQGIMGIRNLGVKSAQEIERAFLMECYAKLLPYERAIFWQNVLDAN
jgi:DNA-directed RNA polymerase alpha subunit